MFNEILREKLVGLALEIEVSQYPAGAGHLEIDPKIKEADIFHIRIVDNLT
jgi:hypothetical protein